MFCSKCGHQNDDSAAFCSGCGASLQAAPAPVAVEEKTLTPQAKVRSGAIVSLIGALLCIAICSLVEWIYFDPVTNHGLFYEANDPLRWICVFLVVISVVMIWKADHVICKVLSVVNALGIFVMAIFSLLCTLGGVEALEVFCFFAPFNTVALVLLIVGGVKMVTGAFARGKS